MEDDELQRRFADLVANSVQITPEGKVGAVPPREGRAHWLRLSTHVLEEMNGRGLRPDLSRVDETHIPTGADREAAEAVSEIDPPLGWYLVKYNPAQYVRPIAENGEVRIAPATYYDDPSLDPAQRDEELWVGTEAHPDDVEITTSDGETLDLVGNVEFTFSATTNYYVWCLSSVLDARLFREFGDEGKTDAAFLIRDPEVFLGRLKRHLQGALRGWTVLDESVTYIDPLNPPPERPNVYFSKHFRFTYQREYRVVAVPPRDLRELEPIYLEMESMDDVGELIVPPDRDSVG